MSEDEARGVSDKGKQEEVPDPELDNLLDDALQDFTRPQPPKPVPATTATIPDLASAVAAMGVNAAVAGGQGMEMAGDLWTEEFIQNATSQFEQTMRSLMEQQQGTFQQQKSDTDHKPTTSPSAVHSTPVAAASSGETTGGQEVDISSISAQFTQFVEAAGRAANDAQSDADFTHCLADTLSQLRQNNEQLQSAPTSDELSKMFEGLGLTEGDGAGEEGALGGLFPLMQVMLENILSKDVLHQPLKEITDKYPDWLADQRTSLSEEEYQRYNSQYHIMSQVVGLYEAEGEDTEEVKRQRFQKIMISMQKLQELGQPPKELVGDMGPIINFDPAGNPVLPNLSALSGDGTGQEAAEGSGDQCVVM